MKAKVTITFDIETDEYHLVKPDVESATELVKAMLNCEADLPEKIDIDVTEI